MSHHLPTFGNSGYKVTNGHDDDDDDDDEKFDDSAY